jgi:cysteine desulfurase
MSPYMAEWFTNPATLYTPGRENEQRIEAARATVAAAIGAEPEEIYFTSGGTESDNWAVKGAAWANEQKGRHIITSAVEHHAVLEPCEYLAKHGWELTVLPVDSKGIVDPGDVKKALRDDTVLVTIMHANNEVGAIEPIAEIAKIAHEKGAIVHTDAVQTIGKISVDMDSLGIDILSASAHKLYGPKGMGFAYIRKGTRVEPLSHGGGQERGKRSGTLNVPGIIGLAKAVELGAESIEAAPRLSKMARDIWEGCSRVIPDLTLNTDLDRCLPGFLNFVAEGVEGEAMLLRLDAHGVCVSSGSACTTGSLEPSHVLLALGLPPEVAHGSLRFTLGRENTAEEVRKVIEVLPGIIKTLRDMSPTYKAKR